MMFSPGQDTAPLKPLKFYQDLATRKGRREHGAFIVEGEKAVRRIIKTRPESILEIVSAAEAPRGMGDYPARTVTAAQFSGIATSKTPQGLLAVVRIPADVSSPGLPADAGDRVLLLEDIQDPGNVGTLLRTAAAFGFSGAILTEKCADPFSPKCVQATAGTVLSLWLRRTSECLEMLAALRPQGYSLVATELNGKEDTAVLKRPRLLLALGNEAAGLSPAVLHAADFRLRIPTATGAESLNVAAAGAICIYLSTREKTAR
ncbi:MAG: RNA methyltransferase [Chloroflexota bacterium]